MLEPRSRILIVVAIALVAGLGVAVHHAQNATGAMGGRISTPKLVWLIYTLFVWGLLCPILAADRSVAPRFRIVIGSFAALMWLRGIAEIFMLYVFRNWRPPIGMAHDLACAGLLAFGLAWSRPAWRPVTRTIDGWLLAFTSMVLASVLVECLYAGLFERAVRGATTGRSGLWFAAPGDPRFTLINRLTAGIDVPLCAFLAAFIAACLVAARAPAESVSR